MYKITKILREVDAIASLKFIIPSITKSLNLKLKKIAPEGTIPIYSILTSKKFVLSGCKHKLNTVKLINLTCTRIIVNSYDIGARILEP